MRRTVLVFRASMHIAMYTHSKQKLNTQIYSITQCMQSKEKISKTLTILQLQNIKKKQSRD